MTNAPPSPHSINGVHGNGWAAQKVRNTDWSNHALGEPSSWSSTLATAVGLMANSKFPMFVAWGKHRTFLYNEAYAPILGAKHPDAFGKPFREVWSEIWEDLWPLIRSVDEGESVYLEDLKLLMRRHGFEEETYFTFSYSPIFGTAGQVEGLHCACFETTEKILSERAIQQFKNFAQIEFEKSVDVSPAILWITDPDGKCTYLSKQWYDFTGQSLEEGLGFGWLDATHPDDKARASKAFVESNAKREAFYVEYRLRTKSGGYRWAIDAGNPRIDRDGNYLGYAGTVFDVHDRKLAEIRSETERLKIESIFVDSPAPMALLRGPTFIFEKANLKYLQLVGNRDIVGKPLRQALPELVDQPFEGHLRHVLETGEKFVGNEVLAKLIQHPGDEPVPTYLNFTYSRVDDGDGNPYGIYVHAVDMTDQVLARRSTEKLAADLQTAVQTRDEFLSIASHELKTPITSLKMQLQMTRRAVKPEAGVAPSPDRLAKTLDLSTRQVDRLTALIEDLLDVSRIGSGKMNYRFETVNLADLVLEVFDRFSEQLASVECPVEMALAKDVIVDCDRFRIEQVVTNLITNAIKYGAGNPIHFSVRASTRGGVLEIADLGMGIAVEEQGRVFDRFARAITHNNISGLGLGLYISKQIVDAHGGTIVLESELGKGAKFTVELPSHR